MIVKHSKFLNNLNITNMDSLKLKNSWSLIPGKVFWGEIAPCDHVVQIYENDEVFLDLLNGFVSDGIRVGDAVIVIATAVHLEAMHERLEEAQYDVSSLTLAGRYIPLNAEEMLGRFMVNDWPDENLFMDAVSELLLKAKIEGRQVRAFGEMVAILWAKGQVGATVRLEQLWNKFCETESFCLFCAYPESGFTQDATESVMHICGAHSKMINGSGLNKTDILYKEINQRQTG
jgi:hypothetical protein